MFNNCYKGAIFLDLLRQGIELTGSDRNLSGAPLLFCLRDGEGALTDQGVIDFGTSDYKRQAESEELFRKIDFFWPDADHQNTVLQELFDLPIDVVRQARIDAIHRYLARNLKIPKTYFGKNPDTNTQTLWEDLQIEQKREFFAQLKCEFEAGERDASDRAEHEADFIFQLQSAISAYPQQDKQIYPDKIIVDGIMNCTARAALVREMISELGILHCQPDVPGKFKHTTVKVLLQDGSLLWLDPALPPAEARKDQIIECEDILDGESDVPIIRSKIEQGLDDEGYNISLAPHSKIHEMMSWLPKEIVHSISLLDAQTATRQMFLSADGWTHDQNGDLEEAKKIYQASIAYKTSNANPYCGYADVLRKQGNTHEAALAYLRASHIDETQGYACYRLAGLLAEMGKIPESRQFYEEALRRVGLNGSRSDAHLELAQICLKLRDFEKADEHFLRAWQMACDEYEQDLENNRQTETTAVTQQVYGSAYRKIINYHSWIAMSLKNAGEISLAQSFDALGKKLLRNPLSFREVSTPSIDLSGSLAITDLPVAAE